MSAPRKKLIEVALPLEAINRESAREKSIRHGHPSTLHLWWSRKPLATVRAVLFAQLVDDPSSRPDLFPTEAAQKHERQRLHNLLEELVVWENLSNARLLDQARAEILKSCDGSPPPILDPFAGGGSIPLEAQRLGLEAHASDLNPVAVLINKALIEIPPKFSGLPPVYSGLAESRLGHWKGAEGLAADVRAYGEWIRVQAKKRVGHLFPHASLADSTRATVIAWIWARTVICPNPVCGIEMPLVSKWWLGKKPGKEAFVQPHVVSDSTHPSGKRVAYTIEHDPAGPVSDGTVNRNGASCVACGSSAQLEYVRSEAQSKRLGSHLLAIVAEGVRSRIYLPSTPAQLAAAIVARPDAVPDAMIPPKAPSFRVQAYGMTAWADLFTNRQLTVLSTFSDLVTEARGRVIADALGAGLPSGERLEQGGTGADAYADAVAIYLGLAVSRSTERQSAICTWDAHHTKEQVRGVFARQAIPMVWDFAESNPFARSSGTWLESVDWVSRVLERLPAAQEAVVRQSPADVAMRQQCLISTDPPYYDNIGYSDLSDFFYVWLRRSLRDCMPELLGTMLVPKAEELVANPYRHGGKAGAKDFFESGFRDAFAGARLSSFSNFPITVYYAFKQSDAGDDGISSTGWETLLEGMIRSGWSITATWPVRSELSNRMLAKGTNALASSIVLALRPRPADAPTTDRRGLIAALQDELPNALRALQQGAISPVDLPQAAIGPGMAVFSRYASVIEADGSPMTVRSALARINEILDQVLNEQEGDFDATSRFCIAWYRQHGYATGVFGEADNLARARNTSVDSMDRSGVLLSRAGRVTLLRSDDLPQEYDVVNDDQISSWEILHHLIRVLDAGGVPEAGQFLAKADARRDAAVDADLVKELAFLLFSLAEKNGWTKDALAFNTVATSWPDIVDAARSQPEQRAVADTLDFSGGEE